MALICKTIKITARHCSDTSFM